MTTKLGSHTSTLGIPRVNVLPVEGVSQNESAQALEDTFEQPQVRDMVSTVKASGHRHLSVSREHPRTWPKSGCRRQSAWLCASRATRA